MFDYEKASVIYFEEDLSKGLISALVLGFLWLTNALVPALYELLADPTSNARAISQANSFGGVIMSSYESAWLMIKWLHWGIFLPAASIVFLLFIPVLPNYVYFVSTVALVLGTLLALLLFNIAWGFLWSSAINNRGEVPNWRPWVDIFAYLLIEGFVLFMSVSNLAPALFYFTHGGINFMSLINLSQE